MPVSKAQPSGADERAKPQTSNDPLVSGYLSGSSGAQEAWRMFVQDGRHRLARPDDFRIPDWAMRLRGKDLEAEISYPIVAGIDINHDGRSYDFAVIVVDTMRTDPERFGIVIFNAPKTEGQPYGHYWLYKERDLSRTTLSRVSSWTYLTEYEDDGSQQTCNINWDAQNRKYNCTGIRGR